MASMFEQTAAANLCVCLTQFFLVLQNQAACNGLEKATMRWQLCGARLLLRSVAAAARSGPRSAQRLATFATLLTTQQTGE